jgi:hypothetical protein
MTRTVGMAVGALIVVLFLATVATRFGRPTAVSHPMQAASVQR